MLRRLFSLSSATFFVASAYKVPLFCTEFATPQHMPDVVPVTTPAMRAESDYRHIMRDFMHVCSEHDKKWQNT